MEFNKYRKKGAYHWDQYQAGTPYTVHVKKICKWVRKGRTLDVGAGDGVITHFLGATGIDNNELAVQYAQERGVDVRLGTAYELEGEYDNVLMSDALEHLQYPTRALKQVEKVLTENGLLYIVVPPPRRLGAPPRRHHYQEWTSEELVEFMAENGWECKTITVVNGLKRIYGVFKVKR